MSRKYGKIKSANAQELISIKIIQPKNKSIHNDVTSKLITIIVGNLQKFEFHFRETVEIRIICHSMENEDVTTVLEVVIHP